MQPATLCCHVIKRLSTTLCSSSACTSSTPLLLQAGPLTDDQLHTAMIRPLRHGVRLHAVIDACQSCPSLNLRCTARARKDGWSEWQVCFAALSASPACQKIHIKQVLVLDEISGELFLIIGLHHCSVRASAGRAGMHAPRPALALCCANSGWSDRYSTSVATSVIRVQWNVMTGPSSMSVHTKRGVSRVISGVILAACT